MDGVTTTMTKQHVLRLFSILPAFTLASCVTVNLGGGKTTTAQGVSYNQPQKPFEEIKLKDADHAWQNKDNGSTISYLSTCNDPADPGLLAARGDFLASLNSLKIVSENDSEFNGREALTTVAEGKVDGVNTRVELLLFKKNNCLYTLSFVALAKTFNDNHANYGEFVQSFKAP